MKLPSKLWAEAVRHSVYLLNRLPTRALSGLTPYEAWSKRKPDVSHVRVFGCLVHMKIPINKVKKLDDRSKQVINLGREPGTKAYRLFDPKNNRVHVSRDVIFKETKGWDWSLDEDERQEIEVPFNVLDTNWNEGQLQCETTNEDHQRSTASSTPVSTPDRTPVMTPETRTSTSRLDPQNYDGSIEPRKIRSITEIYEGTDEVELDDELLFLGCEEPANYKQAVKDHN